MITFKALTLEEQKRFLEGAIEFRIKAITCAEEELNKMKAECRSIDWKIRKQKAREYVKDFIAKNGILLDFDLHQEMRVDLINILYDDKRYITSFQMVLHTILDALGGIKWEYQNEKKSRKDLKLKIELEEEKL